MLTLRTARPVVTEPLPIPRLNLTGRAPPRGAAVELAHIDTPPNMSLWPLFHNGAAAGLRVCAGAPRIDTTWVDLNRARGSGAGAAGASGAGTGAQAHSAEAAPEHAGFLLALGLNGHLRSLHTLSKYEYLARFHELTSVGLLLGLAAAHRGTQDTQVTRMLSIHAEALLPPTAMELDIPHNVQVSHITSIYSLQVNDISVHAKVVSFLT